ncbi:MAG TPA: bifunctional nuclease family protein [Methylomirabilota bacterium]|nr:bifunctional nuclease family protein [Methylomirabilota bacterium]
MKNASRLGTFVLLIGVGLTLVGARAGGGAAPPGGVGAQEVTVLGVFLDERSQQINVVLQGKQDRRAFAMVIGPAEATGIAVPLQNLTPPRPLTHDLFLTLFARLNVRVTKVVINDIRDNIYYATVYLSANGTPMELDSRPSDAIALAIRAKAPVYAEGRVFEKAPAVPTGPRI